VFCNRKLAEEQQIHDGTDFVAQHYVFAVAHIAGATQGKRIANSHEAPLKINEGQQRLKFYLRWTYLMGMKSGDPGGLSIARANRSDKKFIPPKLRKVCLSREFWEH
jgi:hypothetical protein